MRRERSIRAATEEYQGDAPSAMPAWRWRWRGRWRPTQCQAATHHRGSALWGSARRMRRRRCTPLDAGACASHPHRSPPRARHRRVRKSSRATPGCCRCCAGWCAMRRRRAWTRALSWSCAGGRRVGQRLSAALAATTVWRAVREVRFALSAPGTTCPASTWACACVSEACGARASDC
jgi:hypothetical protein